MNLSKKSTAELRRMLKLSNAIARKRHDRMNRWPYAEHGQMKRWHAAVKKCNEIEREINARPSK